MDHLSYASRGASPLGLPYTLSRAPLRRRAPFAWLTRCRSLAPWNERQLIRQLLRSSVLRDSRRWRPPCIEGTDVDVNVKPDISVVIPTYNRGDQLRPLLAALLTQEARGVSYEILVV